MLGTERSTHEMMKGKRRQPQVEDSLGWGGVSGLERMEGMETWAAAASIDKVMSACMCVCVSWKFSSPLALRVQESGGGGAWVALWEGRVEGIQG